MLDRIKYFLPSLYGNDPLIRSLVQSFRNFTDELQGRMRHEFNQLSASTADEGGIAEWEKELAITPREGAGVELRRALVRAKLMRLPTVTPERLTAIANQFTYAKMAKVVHPERTYILEIRVPMEDVVSSRDMYREVYEAKPAHLGLYIVLEMMITVVVTHCNFVMQRIRADHCVWNLGAARSTYWDGEFFWDGTIRYDGIYPDELYRERQLHLAKTIADSRTEISFAIGHRPRIYGLGNLRNSIELLHSNKSDQRIESTQIATIQNDIKPTQNFDFTQTTSCRYINQWDGSFCWDGSHTWYNTPFSLGKTGITRDNPGTLVIHRLMGFFHDRLSSFVSFGKSVGCGHFGDKSSFKKWSLLKPF